ncbi:MAG: crossover junction endodeoxyribonuclease RuvC [Candidatus Peribacteraceae bacterium]|nr:crossover junction endodeoxyribonuclease RuvC [Candidatus Peribacteraceae bacterium]
MILSIDQSLSCSGIMLWSKGKQEAFWVFKTEPKTEVVLRIRDILADITTLVKTYNIEHIVVESLPFGINSNSVRPLAALYFFIQNLCLDLGITFSEANVTAVKKLATGSGKAKKSDMIAALLEDAPELHAQILVKGIKKTTGLADLADAYFIGKYYHAKQKEKDV